MISRLGARNVGVGMRRIFKIALCAAAFFCAAEIFAQTRNAQRLFAQGIEAEDERDWWAASEKFQAAVRANPAYADAWFHLAKCLYQMQSFELALQHLQNAKKYSPERTDILNLEGMSLISLGRFDDAEKIFSQIQKRYPNDIESRFGLAELNLLKGRTTVAEKLYSDALSKSPGNVKALLSLALLKSETKDSPRAERYVNEALRVGSADPQVYYIAAFLDFTNGKFDVAEKRCLSALQLDGNYGAAYELLSLVYFAQGRFAEVIDLADFGISRDRENGNVWYVKGLAQQKLGLENDAIETWLLGLDAVPDDEIMRAAFELSVLRTLPLEDPRRADWAKFHIQKGAEHAKRYSGRAMRYEYQAALRLDPHSFRARNAFSNLLRAEGYSENYLSQMRFIQENEILQSGIHALKDEGKRIDAEDEKFALVKLSDTVEGYESLLENTLARKWDVNPFFLDKRRWNLRIYYTDSSAPLAHPELSRVAAEHLCVLFGGVLGQSVEISARPARDFSAAYSDAYKGGFDYFLILDASEDERVLKFDAAMYSGRNGTEAKKFSTYKTGNDRYASSLLNLRSAILGSLPIRAKILNRSGKDILVDIGRTEGMTVGAKFAVIKRGALRTADTGVGVSYSEENFLGTVTLSNVGEDISEGVLGDTGFYDLVNARDEIVLVEMPGLENLSENDIAEDTSPAANQRGVPVLVEMPEINDDPLRGALSTGQKNSTLVDMIRRIR